MILITYSVFCSVCGGTQSEVVEQNGNLWTTTVVHGCPKKEQHPAAAPCEQEKK